MKKLLFNPEDFHHSMIETIFTDREIMAMIAQTKFDEWYREQIENAPTVTVEPLVEWLKINPVYLKWDRGWIDPVTGKEVGECVEISFSRLHATHKAKLVCITELNKEGEE